MKKILTLSIVLIMLFTALSGCNEQKSDTDKSNNNDNNTTDDNSEKTKNSDLPVIENIGIDIDYYNETTNKAGDFQFDTFTYSWGGNLQ